MVYDSESELRRMFDERDKIKQEADTWLREAIEKYISEGWDRSWAELMAAADKLQAEIASSEMPLKHTGEDVEIEF